MKQVELKVEEGSIHGELKVEGENGARKVKGGVRE